MHLCVGSDFEIGTGRPFERALVYKFTRLALKMDLKLSEDSEQ